MTGLLQSSRDQFCNLHMELPDGVCDGWDKRFFLATLRAPGADGRDTLKISFECSILYRLLVLMGAHFLRSSRCRKATGLSVQLTYRNPSGCRCARSETCRTKGNTM